MRKQLLWLAVCVVWSCGSAVAQAETQKQTQAGSAEEREQAEFFENQIRPLLVEHCYDCHSGDEFEAGLRLDSRQGWETGGDSGAAIIPGDVDKSLVIEAIRYSEDVIAGMPPDSKLHPEQIELLERWVRQGAYDPRKADAGHPVAGHQFDVQARRAEHWSWTPIKPPAVPEVEDREWPSDSIDRFVLHKIEAAGLEPAPPADKLTWLRRVTFDLTGLPPSTGQIDAFLADHSSAAKRRVVDELLDSVAFGEKWARHWMDVVRYADSYGHEFDYKISHSHEYRDYLIRAFNADVPYEQMVREHIAGDLIDNPRRNPQEGFNESIIGTGFWYLHEATHAPTDVLQNESDIASNQIDVFGKGFLGLTVACARCHDHKFDAISTADYYGMFAYLQSSCRQEFPLDPGEHNRQVVDRMGVIREEAAERLSKTELLKDAEFNDATREQYKRWRAKSEARAKKWQAFHDRGRLLADFAGGGLPTGWSTSGLAFESVDDSLGYLVSPTSQPHRPGSIDSGVWGSKATGMLRSPTFEITGKQIHLRVRSDAKMSIRLVIDNYELAEMSALLFKKTFLRDGETSTNGQWRWLTLGGDLRKYIGHRACLQVIDRGEGSIAVDAIWISDQGAPPADVHEPERIDAFDVALEQATAALAEGRSTPMLRWLWESKTIGESVQRELTEGAGEALRLAATELRPARYVVAMADVSRESMPIYIRGAHANRGEMVPPRNLEALGGGEGDRLQLADEIASIDNPLTARVFVNRIWHHLFGRGIVATVDDFGPQGLPPTHPHLLDHLAYEFADQGWSTKRMIRRIVLSQTYGQSSVASSSLSPVEIANIDPENKLLHRANVRRLPAESIRDGILATSGYLSGERFGPGVPTYRTPFMTGRGARPSGPLDGEGKRSVYQAVYRNFLNPFLTAFDMPNPFGPKGKRSTSNVPAQSLAMMNDAFVIDQAKRWAESMVADETSAEERIREMVLRAHGRPPSEAQVTRLTEFVRDQTAAREGDEVAAWQDLAQTLWNMKAFLYLR